MSEQNIEKEQLYKGVFRAKKKTELSITVLL